MMKNLKSTIALGVIVCTVAFAQAPPEVPESLKVPAGEVVALAVHATGVQICVCQSGPSQNYAWVLKAPEAELTDSNGKIIGHHFAGPTWKNIDGSEVTGKVVAKQDAPAAAIPWLLLSAASHTGSGVFEKVTSIQRIHTEGGLPPQASDCNASAAGKEEKSKYSADYYFYAPGPK